MRNVKPLHHDRWSEVIWAVVRTVLDLSSSVQASELVFPASGGPVCAAPELENGPVNSLPLCCKMVRNSRIGQAAPPVSPQESDAAFCRSP